MILMEVANETDAAAAKADSRANRRRDAALKEDAAMAKEAKNVIIGHEGLIKVVLGGPGELIEKSVKIKKGRV